MNSTSRLPGTSWIRLVSSAALALLATSAGCVVAEDGEDLAEDAVASELTGTTTIYKCMSPLCGGAGLRFDSRDLHVQDCAADRTTNSLVCDANEADSPAMPAAFWGTSWELRCASGLHVECTSEGTTADAQSSCLCMPETGATSLWQPIRIRKRLDKSTP